MRGVNQPAGSEKNSTRKRKKPATKQTKRNDASAAPQESSPITASEKKLEQILLKVPPRTKAKAQKQADLAFKYGWIPSASLVQLFIWLIDQYLDAGIRKFIAERRQQHESTQASEES